MPKKRRKRKYTKRNGEAAIKIIARIRGRNNRLWMRLLSLAVQNKPREAKKIIQAISANDQDVNKWMARI